MTKTITNSRMILEKDRQKNVEELIIQLQKELDLMFDYKYTDTIFIEYTIKRIV